MGDVAAWREYLGEVVAVEMEPRFVPALVTRACNLGLGTGLSYYVGNIDALLGGGADEYNRLLADVFPVDLVNLDYCGGLLYEGFERVAAIAELLRYQARALRNISHKAHPYHLLFITHNSGPTAGQQRHYVRYLDQIREESTWYSEPLRQALESSIDWYKSDDCPPEYRHKVFVLGKVMEFAQPLGLSVSIEHVIAYRGDNQIPMMHYSLRITPVALGQPLSATTRVDFPTVLNAPVLNTNGSEHLRDDLQRPLVTVPQTIRRRTKPKRE
jgi:hypothetical protein